MVIGLLESISFYFYAWGEQTKSRKCLHQSNNQFLFGKL